MTARFRTRVFRHKSYLPFGGDIETESIGGRRKQDGRGVITFKAMLLNVGEGRVKMWTIYIEEMEAKCCDLDRR